MVESTSSQGMKLSSADSSPGIELTTFEDLLVLIGGWCRYQKTLLVFFFINCLFLAYSAYTPVLFLYTPDHFCSVDHIWNNIESQEFPWDKEELTNVLIPIDHSTGKKSKCLMYDVSIDKMNWVCGDSWKGPFSQSMFSFGSLFGTIGLGYVADAFGRLSAWYAANILLMITGLVTPVMTEFVGFSCLRFLQGISFDSFFSIFYVLALECVPSNKRALIGNLALAIGMTVAGCYEPWALYFLQDWKILNTILYAQVAVIILAPWFVFESVRWLSGQGRIDEAYEELVKIAKVNGRKIDPCYESRIKNVLANTEKNITTDKKEPTQSTLLDLMKTPNLRRNYVVMITVFMLTCGLFDMNVRIIGNLEQSIYTTFTISSFLELPADLLAIWGLDWIGRRWSAFISLLLSGIAMSVASVLTTYPLAVLVLTMVGRFFATYALNTVFSFVMEIVPTVVRGQGVALARFLAGVVIFSSPYVVFTGTIHASIPYIIIGVLNVFNAFMVTLLPETANRQLPDTLEDGITFGKDQSFWLMPCIKKIPK